MIETIDSDPPLDRILLHSDVGHPPVLQLLMLRVVVEVAPVLHVAVTAVGLELHGWAGEA